MKYFATTFIGAEEIVEKELKLKAIKQKGFLIFNKKPKETLKSVVRAGIYLKHFNFKDLKEYKKQISDLEFPIKKDFAVYCERYGKHKFASKDIEIETANQIDEKVNLESPETLVYVLIKEDSCLIGIDLFKRRLDKRSYRIKPHPNQLNSSIANIALKFSNFTSKKTLLDPFCGSGIIPIEAALLKGEVYASDNQYYCIESTSINSKIAKVKINVSKTEIKELNKKSFFDFLVTDPPIATIRGLKGILPLYDLFFEKSFDLLKKKGTLTIITTRPQPLQEEIKNFKLKKQLILDKNNLKYYILVFKKH
ncbi:MAG: hypothetical protein CMH64_01880 [Nanoarchaeota archaeon]|nr:hypothetical protein [Nanoarchaeota archaeon]|tara:strand:- start:594 stop:1520 length:927 start_codon:yes stop_codon:yes gene_type:complete